METLLLKIVFLVAATAVLFITLLNFTAVHNLRVMVAQQHLRGLQEHFQVVAVVVHKVLQILAVLAQQE